MREVVSLSRVRYLPFLYLGYLDSCISSGAIALLSLSGLGSSTTRSLNHELVC